MEFRVRIKVEELESLQHGGVLVHGKDENGRYQIFTLFEEMLDNVTSRHDLDVGDVIEIIGKIEYTPIRASIIFNA